MTDEKRPGFSAAGERLFMPEHQERIDGLLAANMALHAENNRLQAVLADVDESYNRFMDTDDLDHIAGAIGRLRAARSGGEEQS